MAECEKEDAKKQTSDEAMTHACAEKEDQLANEMETAKNNLMNAEEKASDIAMLKAKKEDAENRRLVQ